MTVDGQARVSILVPTYRRPQQLLRLLESLEHLEFRSTSEPEIEVVVVDNAPEGDGVQVVVQLREAYRWPLRAVLEARPGISEARNRALAEASEPEFLVFVDDDEHVSPLWLDELLRVQRETDAHAVAGPVLPELPQDCPDWIRAGGFFGRARYPDASSVGFIASGNLLLSRAAIDSLGHPVFDPAFSFTGGGDTQLALRLRKEGGRMHWADRAVVHETVPRSRATPGWLIRRWFRLGGCLTLAERSVDWTVRKRAERTIKGIGKVVLGLVMVLVSAPFGRVRLFRSLRLLMTGAGMLSAMAGVHYREYARG